MNLLNIHEVDFPEDNFDFNKLHNEFIKNIKKQEKEKVFYYVKKDTLSDSIVISNKIYTLQINKSKINGQQFINIYDSEFIKKITVKLDHNSPNGFHLIYSKEILDDIHSLGAVVSMSDLIRTTFYFEKNLISIRYPQDNEILINNNYSVRKKEDGSFVVAFLEDPLISKILIPKNSKNLLVEVDYSIREILDLDATKIIVVNNYEEFLEKYEDLILLSKDIKFTNKEEVNKTIDFIKKLDSEKNKKMTDIQELIKKMIPPVGKLAHLVKSSSKQPDYINKVIEEHSKNGLLIEDSIFFNNVAELSKKMKTVNESFNQNIKLKKLSNKWKTKKKR